MSREATANDLMLALRTKFAPPEFALFPQVANATGFAASRTADAIGMSLWPSRGLELYGFEIKVSRGDWLRELKDPSKAETIAKYCDRWWVVVPDAKLVAPGELPPTWGLMALRGKGLRVASEAPKLSAAPITRAFLAALLRGAHKSLPNDELLQLAVDKARAEERERYSDGLNAEAKRHINALALFRERVEDFEKASGIHIGRWADDSKKIGDAVRRVLASEAEVDKTRQRCERMRQELDLLARHLDEVIQADRQDQAGGST